jgi:hypothetical protein
LFYNYGMTTQYEQGVYVLLRDMGITKQAAQIGALSRLWNGAKGLLSRGAKAESKIPLATPQAAPGMLSRAPGSAPFPQATAQPVRRIEPVNVSHSAQDSAGVFEEAMNRTGTKSPYPTSKTMKMLGYGTLAGGGLLAANALTRNRSQGADYSANSSFNPYYQ